MSRQIELTNVNSVPDLIRLVKSNISRLTYEELDEIQALTYFEILDRDKRNDI